MQRRLMVLGIRLEVKSAHLSKATVSPSGSYRGAKSQIRGTETYAEGAPQLSPRSRNAPYVCIHRPLHTLKGLYTGTSQWQIDHELYPHEIITRE